MDREVADDGRVVSRVIESSIRVGALLLLAVWCYRIVEPFLTPIFWGAIIAVAGFPAYQWLERRLGGHRWPAAVLFTGLALLLLILPTLMLSSTLLDGVRSISRELQQGQLAIPPPPPSVAAWPFVGESIHQFWSQASNNLKDALATIAPQLQAAGAWLLKAAAGAGLGVLQFTVSILIAGVLLAHGARVNNTVRHVLVRLAGDLGREFADLAGNTVRSVAQGVLGVALIQALAAGIGFLAADVPGAGLWALVCLILSVIQLGVGLVMIPVAVYVFATADTLTAILFLVWAVFITLLDNILKPILLGRGVNVPMVVIFMGAIGGFLSSGIIGLFVGAVVLVLGYTLFLVWLNRGGGGQGRVEAGDTAPPGAPPTST
jgi:predicted PurR-regulated permease PerM